MPLPSCAQFMRNIVRDEKYLFHYFDFVRLLLSSSIKYTFRINKFQYLAVCPRCMCLSLLCAFPLVHILFRQKSEYVRLFAFNINPHVLMAYENNKFDLRPHKDEFLLVGWKFFVSPNLMETLHGPGASSKKKISKIIMSFPGFIEHVLRMIRNKFLGKIKFISESRRNRKFFCFKTTQRQKQE